MLSGRGGAAGRGRIRPARRIGILGRHAGQPASNDDFDPSWDLLRTAITDIHRKSCSTLHFEQLYRASYKIVLKKQGGRLYDSVREFETEWFKVHVIPDLLSLVSVNLVNVVCSRTASIHERRQMGEQFLARLRDAWVDHNTSMNMVADVLMYLDRAYVQEARRPSIFTTTIGLYRDGILKADATGTSVFDVLNSVLLDQIGMERNGEVVDRTLIKSICGMLDGLYETDDEHENEKLYFTVFEPEFLRDTREFYKRECQTLLSEADVAHWLRHTLRRLQEESDRCVAALHLESQEKVVKIVEETMITTHLDDFLRLETGLRWMIDNDKLEDLGILYEVNLRVDNTLASLKRMLQNRAVELGKEIERVLKETDFSVPQSAPAPAPAQGEGENADGDVAAKAKPQISTSAQQTAAAIKWVDDVLGLKDKFDAIWQGPFKEDLILQTALTKSFSDFINGFDRASEYVSLFIDDLLRKGIRGKSEDEIDVVLEKAVVLIRYLLDKDMFERYYQKHLARRLLNGKSESHDVERQMIMRMKQEFGNQFTTRFEGMFRDMELSADITNNYRDHVRTLGDDNRIDLSVNILTTNSWPPEVMGKTATTQVEEGKVTTCTYPPEIEKLHSSLKAFYLTNRSGRKLTWVAGLGTADIKCTFPAIPGKSGAQGRERKYEINVSTYGMIVLMLFNDIQDASLSFEEIQAKTNIPQPELVRTLHSLTFSPKFRILVKEAKDAKEPASKTVQPTDSFRFNKAFVSKTVKIKIPVITAMSKVEAGDERKATEDKTEQARGQVMDAAIVRIMKQRKQLAHTQLLTEVINQLAGRFKPEIGMVKKRIEDLIAREFIERVEDATTPTYKYLA